MTRHPDSLRLALLMLTVSITAYGHEDPPAQPIPATQHDASPDTAITANQAATVSVTDQAACTTQQAPYRDFDFWIGEWEVYDASNNELVGSNSISRLADGCLLLEQWQSVQGNTGTSMNFYDPLHAVWRQVWQSNGVFIDYQGALDDNGAMLLEGTISYHKTGRTAPFRGRWQPQEDGSVLQVLEEFHAASGQWSGWFTGIYRRLPEPAP